MKILVVGSGGREHALVWKLAQSGHVTRMWCSPGNAGIAEERLSSNGEPVSLVGIGAEDLPGLLSWAKDARPDLTVIGPDNPLAMGIVDLFQAEGLRVWGPNRKAAQFEASKAFSQEFMEKYGIPTARAGIFEDADAAKEFAASLPTGCAVKADGLALGKGVIVCRDFAEAKQAIEQILVQKQFGAAGGKVVIQEFLAGQEISFHALCDGSTYKLFPSSQDHKRALDGDQGLNTGGMGAYSPTPFLTDEQFSQVAATILDRWIEGCRAEGIHFCGLFYPGIMLTSDGPKVLEFNARFGDPETQVYLTRLQSDLAELLDASVDGRLAQLDVQWSSCPSLCVVLASGGYPGSYQKGKVISGLTEAGAIANTKVFQAGTSRVGNQTVTSGGRVLGVTAWDEDLGKAREKAYLAAGKIQFDGVHFRRDIAAKALNRSDSLAASDSI